MRGLRAIFSYRGDRPSGPHANALPQIVSTRRRKTNTTTRKCGKVGKKLPGGLCGLPGAIEKARQVIDPAGFFGFRDLLFARRIRRHIALEDDLRFVRITAFLFGVLGDFVHQADRKTVFVERPIVTGEVNDVHAGRFGDGFVVSAVLIVLIRDPVPVTNVSVLLLGGFHRFPCLFFSQSVEQEPGAISKGGDQPPRGEKLCIFRRNASFWAVKPLNCRFCIKKAG
nr:MAG TPA: hypothetical protein [Caudoviricetes sp.]